MLGFPKKAGEKDFMRNCWLKSPDLSLRGGNLQIADGNLEIPARLRSDLEIGRSGRKRSAKSALKSAKSAGTPFYSESLKFTSTSTGK